MIDKISFTAGTKQILPARTADYIHEGTIFSMEEAQKVAQKAMDAARKLKASQEVNHANSRVKYTSPFAPIINADASKEAAESYKRAHANLDLGKKLDVVAS